MMMNHNTLDVNFVLININLILNLCNYDIMSCLHELCKEQIAINKIIKDDFELYIKIMLI